MILLVVFAFIAGIVTILSPCILPVLPIILSSSVDETGKRRPLGVVVGFVLSFTFFTLFLSTIVRVCGVPPDSLRYVAIVVLMLFGLSLFIPRFQNWLETVLAKLTRFAPTGKDKRGFSGGFVIGLSIGLLWTPCVGPILASVISLALTGTVTLHAVIVTLAYALGTAIPMFFVMQAGSTALQKVPWLTRNLGKIQKAFGVIMILTAVGIYFNVDRKFQTYILTTFPKYGTGLTKLEDNELVKEELERLNEKPMDDIEIGKPITDETQPKGPLAPKIIPGGKWFNSEPLTLKELRGKVVVIDFWTYSCINCQRTFPYLRSWWEKYQDKGLVIIGVHSPEFEFEKSEKNLAQAIEDFDLRYPIVQDNNFETWRAYNNRYWPAKYFIDKDGYVRFTHFGEGAYDKSEKIIQDLLKETGMKDITEEISNPSYTIYSRTPETYLGFARIDRFASPETISDSKLASYTIPEKVGNNQFAYGGQWTISAEYANPQEGSELVLNFESKEVFLVMGPAGEEPARVRVYVDGEMQYFGEDNENGIVTVDSDRLYKLVDLPSPGRHILRLEFLDSNAEIFAFTFG
jgi:cytochrome c biogenesis protein CcdA/thiol-disulfide isomerase/thioredoxin